MEQNKFLLKELKKQNKINLKLENKIKILISHLKNKSSRQYIKNLYLIKENNKLISILDKNQYLNKINILLLSQQKEKQNKINNLIKLLQNSDINLQNKNIELQNKNIELQNKNIELQNKNIELQNKTKIIKNKLNSSKELIDIVDNINSQINIILNDIQEYTHDMNNINSINILL